jgi:hypothetical protein
MFKSWNAHWFGILLTSTVGMAEGRGFSLSATSMWWRQRMLGSVAALKPLPNGMDVFR